MSQRAWIFLVKPPRDRPRAFAQAPFSARCQDVAANAGAIDHMLPVVGQIQINQRLQESVPDTLLGQSLEPDIDRLPLTLSLVHVAPRAANPQHVEHTIEESPIIAR